MKFPDVLELITETKLTFRRATWCPHEFILLVSGSTFAVTRVPLLGIFPEGTSITYRPHIDRCFSDGSIGVWSPTQDDILADDWEYSEDSASLLRLAANQRDSLQIEMDLS